MQCSLLLLVHHRPKTFVPWNHCWRSLARASRDSRANVAAASQTLTSHCRADEVAAVCSTAAEPDRLAMTSSAVRALSTACIPCRRHTDRQTHSPSAAHACEPDELATPNSAIHALSTVCVPCMSKVQCLIHPAPNILCTVSGTVVHAGLLAQLNCRLPSAVL